jgi:hypothetical protein
MLYLIAAQCYVTGRSDDFVRYTTAGQNAVDSGHYDDVPAVCYAILGGGFLTTMPPEQCVDLYHSLMERYPDAFGYFAPNLVFALIFAGAEDEARALSDKLMSTVGDGPNPTSQCGAFYVYGYMLGRTDPVAAREPLRKALNAAQSVGNRQMESVTAFDLANVTALNGDTLAALDFIALSVRMYYDSGSSSYVAGPVGVLVALLDELGDYEQAATISGFAVSPISLVTYPQIESALAHLREVLGDGRYESLKQVGAVMTNAAMADYALEHIQQARARLVAEASS